MVWNWIGGAGRGGGAELKSVTCILLSGTVLGKSHSLL